MPAIGPSNVFSPNVANLRLPSRGTFFRSDGASHLFRFETLCAPVIASIVHMSEVSRRLENAQALQKPVSIGPVYVAALLVCRVLCSVQRYSVLGGAW